MVIAQSFGGGRPDRVRSAIDSLYTAFIRSILPITAAALLLVHPLMTVLRVDPAAWAETRTYLLVVCAGLVGSIGYNLNAGILGGMGNSSTTLLFLAVSTILNIFLDLALVLAVPLVVLFCDELGTMPPFDILRLFSAGRSRGLTLVPIIQSLAQLEKNYGKEGAEIICDNCQDTIFGGFSPQSKTAEALSAALGSRTVLSGSVSQGKESSQSLQMMERPLMTPDELKSIPKGEFVVMKTGTHPMRTRLRLFLDWGITFDPDGYRMPERAARKISYVNRDELARNIQNRRENSPYNTEDSK